MLHFKMHLMDEQGQLEEATRSTNSASEGCREWLLSRAVIESTSGCNGRIAAGGQRSLFPWRYVSGAYLQCPVRPAPH